ncbi:MAG: hypothetical protein VB100_00610 [Angelakisella sp.]|nr:hypothetical protein [Angelakisella sp.]
MKRSLLCGTSLLMTIALVFCTACQSGSANAAILQAAKDHTDAQLSNQLGTAFKQNSQLSGSLPAVTQGKKNETVYVTLDPSGNPRQTIVSDWIHTDEASKGSVALDDLSNLTDISVLKGGSLVSSQNGELLWQMDAGDLYYQGISQSQLPLTVSIRYTLDSKEYEPEQLAGMSGELSIHIALKNNLHQVVTVSGKSVDMFAPLTAVLGLIMPDDVFSNVAVSDGKVVSDGSNQVVAIVAMPGLTQSLNLNSYDIPGVEEIDIPEEFTITATVKNFEMGPIAIAASTQFPEIDADSSEFDEMYNNLVDLQGMQNSIENADPNHEVRSIFTDPQMTKGAQILVDDIYAFYDMDKKLLNLLPDFVTDGNVKLIKRLHDKTDRYDLDQLISSYTADTLFDFAEQFELEKAKLLMGDANSALHLAKQLEDLAKNPAAQQALKGAAGLGLTAQQNPRETAALCAVAGSLTPESISSLFGHYKASGIENLDIDNLAAVFNFYETSGLAAAPELLPQAMGAIGSVMQQKGRALTADEWQTFLLGGLNALNGKDLPIGYSSCEAPKQKVESKVDTAEQAAPQSGNDNSGEASKDTTASGTLDEQGAEQPQISADNSTLPGAENLPAETAVKDSALEAATLAARQPAALVSLSTTPAAQVSLLGSQDQGNEMQQKAGSVDLDELKALITELETLKNSTQRTLNGYGIDVSDQQAMGKLLGTGQRIISAAGNTIMPMAALQQDAKAYAELGQLLTMMQDGTMDGLKMKITGDLAQNQKNIALLQTLVSDPKLNFTPYLNLIQNSTDLRQDIKKALYLADELNVKLSRDGMADSLADAPDTVKTLMKMKDDLNEYRKVSDALRVAVAPQAVSSFQSVFSTLDRLEQEGAVDRYVGQVNDIRDLLARKDAYVELAKNNTIFTAAPSSLETELKFMMKTDEIKIPKETAAPVASTATKTGLLNQLKSKIKK